MENVQNVPVMKNVQFATQATYRSVNTVIIPVYYLTTSVVLNVLPDFMKKDIFVKNVLRNVWTVQATPVTHVKMDTSYKTENANKIVM